MREQVRSERERVERATRVYDTKALNGYDIFVHGFCNRFAWMCSTERLIAQYDAHVTGNHLEAGVGTGYLVDHCRFPTSSPRLGLVDMSQGCLDASAYRLMRYAPRLYKRDLLHSLALDGPKYDSIGISYVLHCVPGSFREKGRVFGHLKQVLNDGGVLFGCTLLGTGVKRNAIARGLMGLYYRIGVFSNQEDDLQSLEKSLREYFQRVDVEVVGCCALFEAR